MTIDQPGVEHPQTDSGAGLDSAVGVDSGVGIDPGVGVEPAAEVAPAVQQLVEGGAGTAGELAGDRPAQGSYDGGYDPAALWRLVTVVDVSLSLPSAYPEVLLQEAGPPRRSLRIPVGLAEGTAIAYAWRRIPTPRPLTHQLLVDLLDRHNVRVEAVRVTSMHDGVFQGELDTTSRIGRQVVPCRPSDALAIALRQMPTVPILVAEWVLADATGG